jgi:amidase
MTIPRPSRDQVRAVARDLGMSLTDDDAQSYIGLMEASLATYEALEAMPDELPPVKYPRTPGREPAAQENPFNAWCVVTEIAGASTGKLAGKRVAIKDNVCVAGVQMMNGASVLKGYMPEIDAAIVTRILDAGGTIVGKTRCEYFCASGASFTSAGGPVLNPHRPSHSAGGSSSGSSVAVAIGAADLAVGGDQGGSIRVPAACCGVVGMKPTFGLVPYTGIMGADVSIDHTGPITRTVADNALLLEVLAGADDVDPRQSIPASVAFDYREALGQGVSGLRVGILREGFEAPGASPAVSERVRAAARVLQNLGAEVEDISVPLHASGVTIWMPVILEGTLASMLANGGGVNAKGLYLSSLIDRMALWRHRADELSEVLKVLLVTGEWLARRGSTSGYGKAQNLGRRLRAAYDEALSKVDLLLLPTMPSPPGELPAPGASRETQFAKAVETIVNTAPFNLTGHPALSLPCGSVDGLPVGAMLVGRHFQEKTIYRAAQALECALAEENLGAVSGTISRTARL